MTALTIDNDALQLALAEMLRQELTKTIRDATCVTETKDLIKAAFAKKWANEKDNWLESSAREALGNAMWRTIQDVIEQAGVKEMVAQIVRDLIETDEFKDSLKQRTIDAVKSTTFYVKASPDEATGDTKP